MTERVRGLARRSGRRALIVAIAGALLVPGTFHAASPPAVAAPPSSGSRSEAARLTLAQLIGQKLVVRMDGTTPSAALLDRVRAGELGGIILYRDNFPDAAGLVATTRALQAAASEGGQPPLLIMTDQEGGAIRNVWWAPPKPDARAMGEDGRSDYVEARGERTGAALAGLGVNVDLAPVADVPHTVSSFMYLERRTFASTPKKAGRLAVAFADGLAAGGALATVKHFPGIGRVKLNTDFNDQAVPASRDAMQMDLAPFRRAINAGVPIVMLSNATYLAWDPDNAAGWSPAIATSLLRDQLGFRGVSITDSLNGIAHARGVSARSLALKAAVAGTDLILLTGDESSTDGAFDDLVAQAEAGAIPRATLRASYDRILSLKATLGG